MAAKDKRGRLDFGTVAGLAVAVAGVLGGYLLEGGKPGDVLGESAALIVFGGCLGATLVANPMALVRAAARRVKDLLFEPADDRGPLVEQLVSFSQAARRQGIVSLEQDVLAIEDPFLRKSMLLAVDGMDLQEIRSTMELEMDAAEHRAEAEAKVFESAGGFAPTIGIIGAVLGLIIVMGDLKDMDKVGKGIAAAFVATIYGVGSANLLFLPAAHKIKTRAARQRQRQELILEGVCGIVEGMNPKMIRAKLEAYLDRAAREKPRAAEAARAA
ncbi:MAG: flagellar motor protein [Bryobacteraceae bacterium]|nr:MAG: flagellar motor protein [Bryobacteraceae bacterium]